ncbi:hypothetical protein CAPTEDRAFT_191067 [Capitella teleta]|uniref:G-protein coupled receptors family 1 profile domain-containing protein n=1 Tax=Capitella teleta TaxID=283909 RepID=R7V310_CAPTE|nr:hypothetical protein CAPTEDRAFT_191067 [Capitella teleta]|eukprot:ELU10701.1 hypothetical protein CAPTEDRAFT_191067 [Capitella teleta]
MSIGGKQQSKRKRFGSEIQVTLTLLSVSIVFMTLNFPWLIFYTTSQLPNNTLLDFCCEIMGPLNAAINFFLYNLTSRRFRREFTHLVRASCCCGSRLDDVTRSDCSNSAAAQTPPMSMSMKVYKEASRMKAVCVVILLFVCLVDARSTPADVNISVQLSALNSLHSRIFKRSTDQLEFLEIEKATRVRRSIEDGIELNIVHRNPIDLQVNVVRVTRRKRDTKSHAMRGFCRVEGGRSVPLGTPFSIRKEGAEWVCHCPAPDSNTGKEALTTGHTTTSLKCRVDHVFCVTGDQRKVPAGTFFHDVNASGHNLTCVCPVHLKGGGEGKTRVACTKDDVIEDGKPHDCLAPTGDTIHPGQEITFTSKGANVSCSCPANPTQEDLNKKSAPCHSSIEAYEGFSCKLPDGRTFRAGETFGFQKEHMLLSCVCPEHVPVAMAPNGLSSEGILYNLKCQHVGAD